MSLLRRLGRAIGSMSVAERMLYTIAVGYLALALLHLFRIQNFQAGLAYAACGCLAIFCAISARMAKELSDELEEERRPAPLSGRGCVLAEFHGGPYDGGSGMVPHSHDPEDVIDHLEWGVDGGRYVATSVTATVYHLEYSPEEVAR